MSKIHIIKKAQWYLLSLFFVLTSFVMHEEYYSITHIDFKEDLEVLQITIQMFTNDLEKSLNKVYDNKFEIGTNRELPKTNEYLLKYLNKNFEISINESPKDYQWIGKEQEKDATYIYLKISNVSNLNKVSIKNKLLIESFPKQENIVKINAYSGFKTLILTNRNPQEIVSF